MFLNRKFQNKSRNAFWHKKVFLPCLVMDSKIFIQTIIICFNRAFDITILRFFPRPEFWTKKVYVQRFHVIHVPKLLEKCLYWRETCSGTLVIPTLHLQKQSSTEKSLSTAIFKGFCRSLQVYLKKAFDHLFLFGLRQFNFSKSGH